MARQGRYSKKRSFLDNVRWDLKRRWRWFRDLPRWKKIAVVAGPILVVLLIIPLLTYVYFARDISDQERLMNRNNTGLVLLDQNGESFYSIGRAERREMVKLGQIADVTEQALLASEDKDFYNHGGFSVISMLGALYANMVTGHTSYGGSTLTQQLAKNTLLTDDRTYLRKYQELAVSIAIERTYTKDEILEMYLNSVFFGENSFGIQDAAETYFGKQPSELSLAESAMLIGVLPAPSAYSPISGNPELAYERQNTVLSRMVSNNVITEAEKEAALAEELVFASPSNDNNSIAPHFAEMVIKELSDKHGYEKVMRSGYRVKTTLDREAQQALAGSVNSNIRYIESRGGSNAGGVVIDPTTGEVRAVVGSADYNNEEWGKVNMATASRQPGSSFKPIYYAAALGDGIVTPSTTLEDKPINLNGWQPKNADNRFRGDVTVRNALSQSLNIPSIEVMQEYGVERSIKAANKLGINTITGDTDYGLALALGAGETRLIDMTNAYAAFANGGRQFKPILVKEIDDKFGAKVSVTRETSRQAISAEGAFLISSILSDNSARSPIFGSSLTVSGRTAAVKTGTTDDSRDAWAIGYSPDYVVGVWVGNNDNSPMLSGGSDMAGPIWRNTLSKLLAGQPDKKFEIPTSVVQRPTCKSGGLADRSGSNTYNEYYLSSALPKESCVAEVPKITVCNIVSRELESIEEDDFDEEIHSRDEADCEPEEIEVCELATGKIVTIEEDDFDRTEYSRNVNNCRAPKQEPEEIEVCELETGKIITIEEDDFDTEDHSLDVNNCPPLDNGVSGQSSQSGWFGSMLVRLIGGVG